MNTPTVLVVDDDESFRTYMTLLLRKQGYAVEALECGVQLIARLASGPRPAVILLDVLLPDGDGIDLIGRISCMGAAAPVIVLSGVGQVKTVVEAMKLGAVEFLMKPFDEGALITAIKDVTENASPDPRLSGSDTIGEPASGLVTLNPKMRQLAEIIKRVARTDVPILIAGESGAGKEVIARHAHVHSERKDRPFIKVNCAALPHELLESELFGYERGAFIGAATDKPGMFERAHGGTLLLDEIGEMSPLMQAKLLHVLQDGTFMRLGGRKTIRVDVRIIAATNINIEKAVGGREFS
jgi:DNA-binding NtrC family response regulator